MVNYKNIKIVLVEPSGPINVGSVARLCANFDVHELRLVSPKCDYLDQDAKKNGCKRRKNIRKSNHI